MDPNLMTPPSATPTPAPTPAPQPPPPQTQQPATTATIPEEPQQPTVLVPERRGGLAGIVDEIRNALAPQAQNVYRDPETGARYVEDQNATPGQQWKRIAAEAVQGAAAGLAAGRGAGNMGKAAAAGVQVGLQQQEKRQALADKQADQDYEIARQNKIDKANAYLQGLKTSEAEFALKRMKIGATHDDITFAQSQDDRERALNSIDLGTYPDHYSLPDVQKQHPEFWKDAVHGNIVAVPNFNPSTGERNGVHLFLRQPGIGDTPAPPGTKAYRFVPPEKPGDKPQLVEFTPTGSHTVRDFDTYNSAAYASMQKWQLAQAKTDLTGEQVKTQKTEQTKNVAQANKANADAKKDKQGAPGADGSLVDMIGVGKMAPERMAYLLSRNQELAQQVAAKYPDYDSSKAAQYPKLYAEFTSGKKGSIGYQLNAGAAAFKHLYELRELNTPGSHIPHTAAWTAYMNKADTVSTELANFYGDATIPGIEHIKATLTSTLPGNRDAAIRTQAQSMSDKVDNFAKQWKNGAPSKYYEDKMPGMDDAANAARAELDPRYAERLKAQHAQPAPQQITIQPNEPQIKLANGNIGVARNGQWVDTGRKAQ